MSGNLDAIKALQAQQAEAAEAAAPKKGQGEQLDGWNVELTAADDAPSRRSAKASGQNAGGDAQAHEQLLEMCARVDLLSLAQADTGETGRRSGNRVDFHKCPLCGHNDCFTVYTDTNTCACFGGSNPETKGGKIAAGGNVLDYLRHARHGGDNVAAITALHELSGIPYEPKRKYGQTASHSAQGGEHGEQDGETLLLPPWESVKAVNPPKRNPPLIHGVVRRGHIMLISGKGKGSKTWTAVELSVAVKMGGEWFGFKCERGDVLHIDPELDAQSLDNRFHDVAAKLYGEVPAEVDAIKKWCLRGVLTAKGNAPTIADLAHDVAARCEYGDFALVVIDSASCFIDGDENAAGDVRRFFAYVLRIAEKTGAAVLVVHHMGKGAKGDWDSIERSRGSAVWGDAPDAPLSLLEIFPPSGEVGDYLQDGERAFVLEDSGLREFPGIEPRHVIFDHPTHYVDADGVTDNWKAKSGQGDAGRASGEVRKAKAEANRLRDETLIASYFIRNGIGKDGVGVSEIAREVFGASGSSGSDKVKRIVEDSKTFGLFKPSKNRCNVVPVEPPPEQPEEPPTLDLEE